MKILYSLPHPGDRLDMERAGHIVRANAILAGLESIGHTIIRLEASGDKSTQMAVNTYRNVIKNRLPGWIGLSMRDAGRVIHSRRYAVRLIDAIEKHQPDCVLETHLAFSLAGMIAVDKTGVPLIIDDVAPAWEEEQQYGVGLKRLARRIYRQVTTRADLLVAVNKTLKRFMLEEGLPENKIVVVENGIDGQRFHPSVDGRRHRIQYGIRDEEVVIVYVGSFQPYHRVELLVYAFAKVVTKQPIRLFLVGEGKYTDQVKAIAADLDLADRIIFTGRIPYEEVASYAAVGDIAVVPATSEYANPMKMYEYMALGKAVIAPNQETITEIAENQRNVYLFEPENIPTLTFALQTLIDDKPRRERLGRQAGEQVTGFTWQARARAMELAIQRLIQKD